MDSNLDTIYQLAQQAFAGSTNEYHAKFAFAKTAYNANHTYKEIAEYLNLSNHSSAIYSVRRADELLCKDSDFKIRFEACKQEYRHHLLNTANSVMDTVAKAIVDYLDTEPDHELRVQHVRLMLIGIKGVGASLEHRSNDV